MRRRPRRRIPGQALHQVHAGVSGLSSSQTYGEYGYGDYYTYNGLRR